MVSLIVEMIFWHLKLRKLAIRTTRFPDPWELTVSTKKNLRVNRALDVDPSWFTSIPLLLKFSISTGIGVKDPDGSTISIHGKQEVAIILIIV